MKHKEDKWFEEVTAVRVTLYKKKKKWIAIIKLINAIEKRKKTMADVECV